MKKTCRDLLTGTVASTPSFVDALGGRSGRLSREGIQVVSKHGRFPFPFKMEVNIQNPQFRPVSPLVTCWVSRNERQRWPRIHKFLTLYRRILLHSFAFPEASICSIQKITRWSYGRGIWEQVQWHCKLAYFYSYLFSVCIVCSLFIMAWTLCYSTLLCVLESISLGANWLRQIHTHFCNKFVFVQYCEISSSRKGSHFL